VSLKLARRDKVVIPIANFVLRAASSDYRKFVKGAILYAVTSPPPTVAEPREENERLKALLRKAYADTHSEDVPMDVLDALNPDMPGPS
jgi:hypothetical protein